MRKGSHWECMSTAVKCPVVCTSLWTGDVWNSVSLSSALMHGNLVYTTTYPGKVLQLLYFLVMRSNRMKSTSMSRVAFLWNAIDL